MAGDLGALLRQAREAAGLSAVEATRALDTVHGTAIWSWEQGGRTPRLTTLARLADLYGLDVRARVRLLEAAGFWFTPREEG